MAKKKLFKGVLRGTATSNKLGPSFVIKLDEKIEGIPEEFVVFNRDLGYAGSGILG